MERSSKNLAAWETWVGQIVKHLAQFLHSRWTVIQTVTDAVWTPTGLTTLRTAPWKWWFWIIFQRYCVRSIIHTYIPISNLGSLGTPAWGLLNSLWPEIDTMIGWTKTRLCTLILAICQPLRLTVAISPPVSHSVSHWLLSAILRKIRKTEVKSPLQEKFSLSQDNFFKKIFGVFGENFIRRIFPSSAHMVSII